MKGEGEGGMKEGRESRRVRRRKKGGGEGEERGKGGGKTKR